jgi:predicted site-specific integrase-resolvase
MPQRTTLPAPDSPSTLRPGDAAKLLGVTVKTLSRYGDEGLVTFDRLPKGHRRYHRASVEALLPAPVSSS